MRKILKTILLAPAFTMIISCSYEKDIELVKVTGTVKETLLVAENSWLNNTSTLKYEIITLSNGKKYRLSPAPVKGIGKDYNVELMLVKNTKPNKNGEYKAHSIKITAIPIPGTNKKLKYPSTNPPVIIDEDKK